jgi:tRNA(Ile)-lysidine synthase
MSDRRDIAPSISAPPLSALEFARHMAALGPFESRPRLAIAVSGGGDSMALLLLADAWARQRGGEAIALTVDHGLRPEAAAEARQVGAWLAARGIAHHVLNWRGPHPTSDIQAAARRARYDLLAGWCRAAGCLHLLLGHTEDDQAETYLLRLERGSGFDGLAAMAAVVELPDVRLLRPLLGVPRARLRETLRLERQDWIEDPSNQNPAFARVRMRAALPLLDTLGLPAARQAEAAGALAGPRAALEQAVAEVLGGAVSLHPAGFAWVEPRRLLEAPEEVSRRALGRILLAVGGGAYLPRGERLQALHRRLVEAGAAGVAATLARCRLLPKRGRLLVCRETRDGERRAIAPGERFLWDGRFSVSRAVEDKSGELQIAPLGCAGWTEVRKRAPEVKRSPLPAPVRPSLPALRDAEGVVAVPHLGYARNPRKSCVNILFRPANSLSGAGFFASGHEALLLLADGVLSKGTNSSMGRLGTWPSEGNPK